jgi:hypothetical protein
MEGLAAGVAAVYPVFGMFRMLPPTIWTDAFDEAGGGGGYHPA